MKYVLSVLVFVALTIFKRIVVVIDRMASL